MNIKTLIDYEIVDIGLNCKCVIKSLDREPIIIFNCFKSKEWISKTEKQIKRQNKFFMDRPIK